MAYKLEPPEIFDVTKPREWRHWKARFTRFKSAANLTGQDGGQNEGDVRDDTNVIDTLIYCMGSNAETIYKTFVYAEGENKKSYETIMEKFDHYFMPKVNLIEEQKTFHSIVQKSGETCDSFLRRLYDHGDVCEFENTEREIMHQFINGMLNSDLAEKVKIMDYKKLTLAKVIEMARIREHVAPVHTQLETPHVDDVTRRGRVKSKKYSGSKFKCTKCGLSHKKRECPAYGKNCLKCGLMNHFKRCCKTIDIKHDKKKLHEVEHVHDDYGSDDTECLFLSDLVTDN